MLCCSVCGDWYPHVGSDRLDICPPCVELNFAGAQPPLDPWADPWREVRAREALDASVDAESPYQRAARARLHASWRWQTGEDAP